MNRRFKSTLLGVGLCAAVAVAGSAFAAGSLVNAYEPLAQAPNPTAPGSPPGSSGMTGTPPSATPGSPTTAPASTPTGTGTTMPATPGTGTSAGGGTTQSNVVFDQLDTNKDGVLTREEFSRATIRTQ